MAQRQSLVLDPNGIAMRLSGGMMSGARRLCECVLVFFFAGIKFAISEGNLYEISALTEAPNNSF